MAHSLDEGYYASVSAEPEALGSTVEPEYTSGADNPFADKQKSVSEQVFDYNLPKISTYKEVYAVGSSTEMDFHPNNRRRVPNSIPFLMKLVDSNLRTSGIRIGTSYPAAAMKVITGIKFSPNPTTFSINSAKIINRYNTMTRWVEEHWGDEIDSIMFSGSTLSFLGYDTGLTVEDRNSTMPYKFIRELKNFFKSNGIIFQDSTHFDDMYSVGSATNRFVSDVTNARYIQNHPFTGAPKERLYINLFFDYVSFLGHFESFDIIEDSTNPYKLTYNCVFKSERTKYHQGKTALSFL
jgi:hypothetical protein